MRSRALSLSVTALLMACSNYSDDCHNTLTCDPPYEPHPYCDGLWYYTRTDGSICRDTTECSKDEICCTETGVCPHCPKRDAAGTWKYPDGETWEPGATPILDGVDADCTEGSEQTGTAGTSGSGSTTNTGGESGDAGGPDSGVSGNAGSGGDSGGAAGAGGMSGTDGTGLAGAAGMAGTSPTAGAAGVGGTAGAAGAAGAAGTTGDAGAAGALDDCPEGHHGRPDEDVCAIDDSVAVFVAPEGADSSPGTAAEPVATLDAAVALAAQRGLKAIHVCAQKDGEPANHPAAPSLVGVEDLQIFGGFDCSDASHWLYDRGLKARFELGVGNSFRIDDAVGVELVDIAVAAKGAESTDDAPEPGSNSVAMWISGSSDVSLNRVSLTAGRGTAGSPGRTETYPYDPDLTLLDGSDATDSSRGAQARCTCISGGEDSIGGAGGDAVAGGEPGNPGFPTSDSTHGQPGTVHECDNSAEPTQHGAAGLDGAEGLGATAYGMLDAENGWLPQAGEPGRDGATGQGGGGGASTTDAPGGGGACGGCGGKGATAGGGGGASIALLLQESSVLLTDTTLRTLGGGNGGAGAPGQVGQGDDDGYAGIGGAGWRRACKGGNGGRGGNGGASGSAAGGVSVGVLWQGDEAPNFDEADTRFELGDPGLGGPAAGSDVTTGTDGIAENTADAATLSMQ